MPLSLKKQRDPGKYHYTSLVPSLSSCTFHVLLSLPLLHLLAATFHLNILFLVLLQFLILLVLLLHPILPMSFTCSSSAPPRWLFWSVPVLVYLQYHRWLDWGCEYYSEVKYFQFVIWDLLVNICGSYRQKFIELQLERKCPVALAHFQSMWFQLALLP